MAYDPMNSEGATGSASTGVGSQHGQDDWVLSIFPTGFFLDVGCGDGRFLSNSLKLEERGWRGIAIDAFPRNFEARPNTQVVQALVYSTEGRQVRFLAPREIELAGIAEHLTDLHKNSVLSQAHEVKTLETVLLHKILDDLSAPEFIEYFSLDIEGAEYEVLRVFPFEKYRFGCLTIEHNFQQPQRSLIQSLMKRNGYSLAQSVKCDDWYISDRCVAI